MLRVFAGTRQAARRLDMEPLALSVNDTAKALSLGRTSIYAMIADGRLDAFKLGRRTLIKMESIRRLVTGEG
jgi:excisionase family DNA binding protein